MPKINCPSCLLGHLLNTVIFPVSHSLATAPVDDEPLTAEEEQALQASKQWFQQNQGIPHEEILAEFGFKPDDFLRR